MIFLIYVFIIAVSIGVPALFRSWKNSKCTATTNGTIVNFKLVSGTSRDTYYFIIKYYVDGTSYKLTQHVWRCDCSKHIGEQVTVHYDEHKPKRAWAETPGKHPYSRFE